MMIQRLPHLDMLQAPISPPSASMATAAAAAEPALAADVAATLCSGGVERVIKSALGDASGAKAFGGNARAEASETISLIMREARARVKREGRSSVLFSDVLAAVSVLGFQAMLEPLRALHYGEDEPRSAKRKRPDDDLEEPVDGPVSPSASAIGLDDEIGALSAGSEEEQGEESEQGEPSEEGEPLEADGTNVGPPVFSFGALTPQGLATHNVCGMGTPWTMHIGGTPATEAAEDETEALLIATTMEDIEFALSVAGAGDSISGACSRWSANKRAAAEAAAVEEDEYEYEEEYEEPPPPKQPKRVQGPRANYSKQEDELIVSYVKRFGASKRTFRTLAEDLGAHRTAAAVEGRYYRMLPHLRQSEANNKSPSPGLSRAFNLPPDPNRSFR